MSLFNLRRHRDQLEEDELAVRSLERKAGSVEKRVLALETEARLITRQLGRDYDQRKRG